MVGANLLIHDCTCEPPQADAKRRASWRLRQRQYLWARAGMMLE